MKISNKDRIGIVHNDESHDSIAYCRLCERFGIRAVLGPRQNYTERDADKWRECNFCRRIFPIYEIKHEGKLVGLLEPEVNPFKSTGEVSGLDNKNFDRQAIRKEEIKKRIREEKDPEIKELLRQGFDVTSYEEQKID
jgi:hypothetical protein